MKYLLIFVLIIMGCGSVATITPEDETLNPTTECVEKGIWECDNAISNDINDTAFTFSMQYDDCTPEVLNVGNGNHKLEAYFGNKCSVLVNDMRKYSLSLHIGCVDIYSNYYEYNVECNKVIKDRTLEKIIIDNSIDTSLHLQ